MEIWAISAAILALGAAILAALVGYSWWVKRQVEAAVPARGKFVQISTGPLHYVEKGQGQSIVMIHGLGAQLGNFDQFLMDEMAKTHHCIAIDRPGMGWSARPATAPANPRAQAAYIAEAIDALGLDRPLLVGHSLGGAIALCLALDFPEKTSGLALLAPFTSRGDRPSPAFAGLAIARPWRRKLTAWSVATPLGKWRSAPVFELVFGPDRVPSGYGRAGGGMLGLRPASFENTSRDYMASLGDIKWMQANYAQLQMPVHILFGRDDRILSPQIHGRDLAASHAHIHYHEINGGHMLPLTQPGGCATFIRNVAAEIRN